MNQKIKELIDHPVIALFVTVFYAFSAGPSLIETNKPVAFWFSIFLGIAILVWWLYFTHKFINRKVNG